MSHALEIFSCQSEILEYFVVGDAFAAPLTQPLF